MYICIYVERERERKRERERERDLYTFIYNRKDAGGARGDGQAAVAAPPTRRLGRAPDDADDMNSTTA